MTRAGLPLPGSVKAARNRGLRVAALRPTSMARLGLVTAMYMVFPSGDRAGAQLMATPVMARLPAAAAAVIQVA